MRKIRYSVSGGRLMKMMDAAILVGDDDPVSTLAETVVQAISTEVEVEVGGVKVHLAMLLDPDHWEDDWRDLGIEDVDEFVSSQVVSS